jgi:predicted CoA-binding protein/signal transduction histidine kinase
MYDFIRKVPIFSDLPEDDLARLCELMEEVELKDGEELFSEGSRGDRAYIIRTGELEVIKTSGSRPILLSVRGTGDVIGEMAILEDAPRSATVRARGDTSLYAINQEQFERLLQSSPTASRVLLNTVLTRYRSTTSLLRQSEKMAQLGTLTAGVAHELNNPAAAVKRGAEQLSQALTEYAQTQTLLAKLNLDGAQVDGLEALAEKARQTANQPVTYMDPLARSDQEYEIENWLDGRGVPDPWDLSPTLVNLGFDIPGLEGFAGQFQPDQLPTIVDWLGATYSVYNLVAEIGQGASRISEIVKALKSYVYLDQAPIQEVNLHEGLDNTLLILRNKLSKIKVIREYAQNLPLIQGYGSELNQVWTNLIDNAGDALEQTPNPQIILRTSTRGDWVRIEVEDNGPGIPAEIQSRIFDPFFTTKPPGKGTGLGLEISYNIVVNKHRGEIKVFSQPGKTVFRVDLPVNFDAPKSNTSAIEAVPEIDDEKLKEILQDYHTIAVVGISSKPDKPAYSVPAYLQSKGYKIIPVNPNLDEVLGEKAYPDLLSVPEKVDIVEIFRRIEDVPPVVEQAIQIGAKVVWMQEGIVHEQACEQARHAGLIVVMDTCMRATHRRLLR